MPTRSNPPTVLFQMTLRVRIMKEPRVFEALVTEIRALGVAVDVGEPILETPRHVIRELGVACQRREHSEAVLKAIRASHGAELMNFSFSR